jgi:hypothetical protein
MQDLGKRFAQHDMNSGQQAAAEEIRETGLELAELIDSLAPEGREKSLAITHLEETVMWAVKAVAIYGVNDPAS